MTEGCGQVQRWGTQLRNWSRRRNRPVVMAFHCGADPEAILSPLRHLLREVEFVAEGRAVEVVLLKPAEFFPVRAVGDHAHQVGALRPAHQRVDAVE